MALNLSDDDELGAYIYNSSHTAKMFRAAKAKEIDVGSKNSRTSPIRKSPRLANKNKATDEVVQTKTIGKKRKFVDEERRIHCITSQNRVFYKCSHDGCTNKAVEAKVCTMHGAKRYKRKCSHEGLF